MTIFDQKAYLADVLKPLTRDKLLLAEIQRALRELQGSPDVSVVAGLDLATLLAIPADLSDLAAHITSVDMFLNKRQSMPPAQFLKKLIAELKVAGHDLTSSAFWKQLQSAKADVFKSKLADFAAAVSLEHQALKVITKEQLSDKAKAQGLGSTSESALKSAVEGSGIVVCSDFKLPTTPIQRGVTDIRRFIEYRSIVDVLLLAEPQRAESIRVIDELTFGPGGRRPITIAQVAAAQKAAETGKDSDALQAAQKALTIVRTDFADSADLQQLVLASFVATTKEMLARGELLASALLKLTKGTGLDNVDAARILAKLSGSTSTRDLNDVTNLVAEGSLADARNTFDAIANVDQFGEAEVNRVASVLAAAENRKATLVGGYEAAMAKRDYGTAANALAQASVIDRQDARLTELLEKLPPPSPEYLVAKPSELGGITLSWKFDGGADCQFIVVRSTDGHAPANTGDGSQLARDLTAATFTDPAPPVAKRVHYSIFAVRRGVASLPASADQIVLPGPKDVTAGSSPTEITLMWRLAPEAVGVQVTRTNPDGTRTPVNAGGANRTTVTGLVTGERYRFSLEAVYVLPDGTRVVSPPVAIDASPRGVISVIGELHIADAKLSDGRDGHRATWTEPGGYSVELWAFPIDEKLPATGIEVDLADLDGIDGRRVSGVLGVSTGQTSLSFSRFRDLRVIAAITVDGNKGLFGASAVVGSAPSVRNPRVDCYGEELVVSWEWPHGDYSAAVSWFSGSVAQSKSVSRAEYKINGGCRIEATAVDRVTISTVAFGNGQKWIASPVEIHIAARLPVVRYKLEIPPSRFGRRKPVRATVESDGFSGLVSLLVVARESSIMPSRSTDGEVVEKLRFELDGVTPASVEFNIPRLVSPFWIRIFPDGGAPVKLEDPPTNQLKG
ncbi:fibronectin type III domain-containing protein [Rhodococcoides fascians]|uniref:fibronectin type III domain-containing protein n=1 Tax=Rhodococcoides fascians TaxID=1828 RepID=UPI001E02C214|nr:fibronectin type III domain-containing protein [Rhodococcus fascians]CAH0231559.1 hypothetical protein SRABI91_02651 [Rhodococcus fascians]